MQSTTVLALLIAVVPCFCQRPFYAGLRPVGIPAVIRPAFEDDRRSEKDLPAVLKGDVDSANRLDQLPPDQQPIWFLNQEQYKEQLRKPQTYPLRPSIFNENQG